VVFGAYYSNPGSEHRRVLINFTIKLNGEDCCENLFQGPVTGVKMKLG